MSWRCISRSRSCQRKSGSMQLINYWSEIAGAWTKYLCSLQRSVCSCNKHYLLLLSSCAWSAEPTRSHPGTSSLHQPSTRGLVTTERSCPPVWLQTIEGDLKTKNIGLSSAWPIAHRRSRWHRDDRVEETVILQVQEKRATRWLWWWWCLAPRIRRLSQNLALIIMRKISIFIFTK